MDEVELIQLQYLVDKLGPTLVAAFTGARKRSEIDAWLNRDKAPSAEQCRRLEEAHTNFLSVAASEGEDTARAWFIGSNVGEDETSPVEALAQDQFDEVRASANALISGSDGF